MPHENVVESEEAVAALVRAMRSVAVVGMKDERSPTEPAYTVPARLQRLGMRVIPVNPGIASALGERAYPTLAAASASAGPFDAVDVFRRASNIPAVVDDLLSLPASARPAVFWMQTGIVHEEAAERLARAGIKVVMDRCLGVDAARFRA